MKDIHLARFVLKWRKDTGMRLNKNERQMKFSIRTGGFNPFRVVVRFIIISGFHPLLFKFKPFGLCKEADKTAK
jgi:hypothetical protein